MGQQLTRYFRLIQNSFLFERKHVIGGAAGQAVIKSPNIAIFTKPLRCPTFLNCRIYRTKHAFNGARKYRPTRTEYVPSIRSEYRVPRKVARERHDLRDSSAAAAHASANGGGERLGSWINLIRSVSSQFLLWVGTAKPPEYVCGSTFFKYPLSSPHSFFSSCSKNSSVMARTTTLSRKRICKLISEGHLIVILNQTVLRLDTWAERHPGKGNLLLATPQSFYPIHFCCISERVHTGIEC